MSTADAVLDALREGPQTIHEIAARTQIDYSTISGALTRLLASQKVQRSKSGGRHAAQFAKARRWRLPPAERSA